MISWQEKDIEDYFCNEGFSEYFSDGACILGRQLDIGVGIIDVLVYDPSEKKIVIVEFKNTTVTGEHIAQIMRYMVGIQDYVFGSSEFNDVEIGIIEGMLAGPDITDDAKTAMRLAQDDLNIFFHKIVVSIAIRLNIANFVRNKNSETYNPSAFSKITKQLVINSDAFFEEERKNYEEFLKKTEEEKSNKTPEQAGV